MPQQTFAEVTFEQYRKPTRRERFLGRDEPRRAGGGLGGRDRAGLSQGRRPGTSACGIERMLRLHCLQPWFTLSDPAVEEALYDSRARRQFVGIDLGREPVPDETTICKCRHLLDAHQVGTPLFARIREHLATQGLQVSRGTIVDATIISAPRSTKNRTKERDPERHQTKKGNQWYFGMKAHLGVDSQPKLIHSGAATAANGHDSQVLPDFAAWPGDAGVGRCRLQWPTRRHPSTRSSCGQLGPSQSASASAPPRDGARPPSNPIESPCESRTCVLGAQAPLRVGQSPVSRAGEEHPLAIYQLRLGEFLLWRGDAWWRERRGCVSGSWQRAIGRWMRPSKRLPDQRIPTELAPVTSPRNRLPSENVK
jgi:IS5 family transposase